MPSYASSNESHYPYSRYLTDTFGTRVYKAVVASGLTCPTRDGTLAKHGCAFCDVRGSSSYFGKQGRGLGVREQLERRIPAIQSRFGVERVLAYFQSYTNTYTDDLEGLREMYETALAQPGVAGLCIGTRPDCLEDPVLDLLEELGSRSYVSVELGVQSFHDETLLWLERGHDRKCSIDALRRLADRAPSVHVCAHLMLGSPTETRTLPATGPLSVAREAALILNALGVRGVKLHQLMVLENTELARRYRDEAFPTLGLEEYTERVADFLSHLLPTIYVERLCATATHSEECLAPDWSRGRWGPHNQLRDGLNRLGVTQGTALAGSSIRSGISTGPSTVSSVQHS